MTNEYGTPPRFRYVSVSMKVSPHPFAVRRVSLRRFAVSISLLLETEMRDSVRLVWTSWLTMPQGILWFSSKIVAAKLWLLMFSRRTLENPGPTRVYLVTT